MRTRPLFPALLIASASASAAGAGCSSDDEVAPPAASFAEQRVTDDALADLAPKIATDAAGHAYLMWSTVDDSDAQGVTVATNAAGAWTATQLASDVQGTTSFDLAIDPNGTAHVLWSDGAVRYRNSEGGTFASEETISGDTGSDWSPSIAIGPSAIHAVWTESAGDDLQYASHTSKGWSAAINIDAISGLEARPMVTVGGLGVPHICWEHQFGAAYDGTNVFWAWLNYDEWEVEIVSEDAIGHVVDSFDCAVDVGGHVHIAYASKLEGEPSKVYYVSNITGKLVRLEVSASSVDVHSVALALDAQSVAHLVWAQDAATPAVQYAKVSYDVASAPVVLAAGDHSKLAPRITVGPSGSVHTVWWERIHADPGAWSSFEPNFWVTYWSNAPGMPTSPTTIGSAGYSLDAALALDGSGKPHIAHASYLERTEADREIYYATVP